MSYTNLTDLFGDIADSIRSKTGSNELIKADAFPEAIDAIQTGVTPSGNINITNTSLTDVTDYATAQVVDADLVASNIKKDVDILGVIGTFEGGDHDAEDAMVMGTLSEYTNDRVSIVGTSVFAYNSKLTTASFPACINIGSQAFASCSNLTTISFPACTSVSTSAFAYCSKLTTASFPVCTYIGLYAFQNCTNLTTASFPVCVSIIASAFYRCTNLTTASFPACTSVYSYVFYSCSKLTTALFPMCTTIGQATFRNCSNLTTASFPICTSISTEAFAYCNNLLSLYLNQTSSVCRLFNSNTFNLTPIAGDTTSTGGVYGSVFVPASLETAYKTATNWSYFSSRIVGV